MKLSCFNPNRKLFSYGPVYLAGNAGFSGLIANSFYRRALNVTQGRFTSSLPMAVLPFLTTAALYTATVTNPLMSGIFNFDPIENEHCFCSTSILLQVFYLC